MGDCMLSCFSRVPLFMTPWTTVLQAPLSRQEEQLPGNKSRQLELVAISFSRDLPDPGIESKSAFPELAGRFFTTSAAWEAPLNNMFTLSRFSRVCLFVTLWTVAHQAPLSMGLSRQDSWSGLPCPPPVDLSDPGTESTSQVSCDGRWDLYK